MSAAGDWHSFSQALESERCHELLGYLSDASALLRLLSATCSGPHHLVAKKQGATPPTADPSNFEAAANTSALLSIPEKNLTFLVSVFAYDPPSEEGPAATCKPDTQAQWWHSHQVELLAARAVGRATGWSHKPRGCDLFIDVEIASPKVACHCLGISTGLNGALRIVGRQGRNLCKKLADVHRSEYAVPEPLHLRERRREAIIQYDMARYPFTDIVAELLETMDSSMDGQTPQEALSRLHERTLQKRPLYDHLAKAYKAAGRNVPEEFLQYNSSLKARLEKSIAWTRFIDTYRKFVKDVCAPLCGSHRVIFQCPPTIRIVLPGAPATIRMHCDADYPVHWKGEINFWLPVTAVFGSNTLWLESEPLSGDFRPMELRPGELLRFNGYECRHYTTTNETAVSRVSFDWRAIPYELCNGTAVQMIGDYPAEMT